MFNITVDDSKLTLFVDFSSRRMVQYVKSGINKAGIETASYVQSRHLTGGTTEDRLGVRSGHLRQSARTAKVVELGNRISGGVVAGQGLIYSPIHINHEGRKHVITANGGGSLAIPLRGFGSRTGAIGYGRTKQPGPRDYPFGFLEPFKTKKGNMLLVHKEYYSRTITSKGKGYVNRISRKVKGKVRSITPYYLLMKSVTVPARVYPERIAIVRRRYIVETIKNQMIKVFQRKTR